MRRLFVAVVAFFSEARVLRDQDAISRWKSNQVKTGYAYGHASAEPDRRAAMPRNKGANACTHLVRHSSTRRDFSPGPARVVI